ncbi:hypothetical protein JOQ06_027433 [Pogonophryne albipinna]|uniref:Uncharacterized protein n=1 Tax=Pogonophryne albipinna TaxID=1090488 RepID=A0AAD6BAL0_9TELE|nr:hypothetical protein JOQ06_027433 [Pogonophryne albipinna]
MAGKLNGLQALIKGRIRCAVDALCYSGKRLGQGSSGQGSSAKTSTYLIADKISGFTRKLEEWGRRLDQGRTDAFESLGEIAETIDSGATAVIPCIEQHITSLLRLFQKHFTTSSAQYDWIMDPLNAAGLMKKITSPYLHLEEYTI